MKTNHKLCVEVSSTPLKRLNESVEESSKKYTFSGIFTACSTPNHVVINRNRRSYPEQECMRHLSYLRESIKTNGWLPGELDHPEGRFEISLKEVSHKITDLWYDQSTHCIMGKLELLNTRNGKTAQELVDAGYPLFVSSRAAGDVNEKTREVEIQQIFTYDIVCTPGFAEARLERVNESALSEGAKTFLNESAIVRKRNAAANKIETSTPNVEVYEINEGVELSEKAAAMAAKPIDMEDVCKPLLTEDEGFELPQAETNPFESNDGSDADADAGKKDEKKPEEKKSDDKKDECDGSDCKSDDELNDAKKVNEEDDDEKEEKRALILDIVGEDEDGNPISGDVDSEESAENADKADDILDIQAEEGSDDAETDEAVGDSEATKKEAENAERIEDCVNKDMAKYDQLLASVQKSESVKESIVRRYPFSISLSEENFAKFAALRPNQKKKCCDFIVEHEVYDIRAINELWSTPLREEKRVQKNWLKLASPYDIDLYCKAPFEVQNAIEEAAKYVILETREDVDKFWQRTGLRQQAAQQQVNEEMVSYYKDNVTEFENDEQRNPLGYKMDFIKMTEDMLNNE